MKKIILFLSGILIFFGCEKEYDTVVDSDFSSYQVKSISSFNQFIYRTNDSLMTLNLEFSNDDDVSNVYCNIISSANDKLNSTPFYLFDNGNNGDVTPNDDIYTNQFPMNQSYPIGNYTIEYFVEDVFNRTETVAVQNFNYDNGQENVPPVVSNLVAPDTVTLSGEATIIFVSIEAEDENGTTDIEIVFFNSFLPDGSPSQANPIIMFDDGTNGDETAGDGIYSREVVLPPDGVELGTYTWEFQARDRRDILSNKIIHNVVIQ